LISAGISTGDGVDNIHECVGITVLVTYEAFVGILFSSMWGAIIFIRLSRIQSFAQVSFSDPIVSQPVLVFGKCTEHQDVRATADLHFIHSVYYR